MTEITQAFVDGFKPTEKASREKENEESQMIEDARAAYAKGLGDGLNEWRNSLPDLKVD